MDTQKKMASELQNKLNKKEAELAKAQVTLKQTEKKLKKTLEDAKMNFIQLSAAIEERNKYKKKTEFLEKEKIPALERKIKELEKGENKEEEETSKEEWNGVKTLELTCPAKINLFFEVKYQREDGYHEIETVMQTVSIYEALWN